MDSPVKRSNRFDIGAACLIMAIGTIHSFLTLQREILPHRAMLLGGGVLMTAVGLSSVAPGRTAHLVALTASAAGVLLSIALFWRASGTPQALPLLMVFGVATIFSLTRSSW